MRLIESRLLSLMAVSAFAALCLQAAPVRADSVTDAEMEARKAERRASQEHRRSEESWKKYKQLSKKTDIELEKAAKYSAYEQAWKQLLTKHETSGSDLAVSIEVPTLGGGTEKMRFSSIEALRLEAMAAQREAEAQIQRAQAAQDAADSYRDSDMVLYKGSLSAKEQAARARIQAKRAQSDAELERMLLTDSKVSDQGDLNAEDVDALMINIRKERQGEISQLVADRLKGKIDGDIYVKRLKDLIAQNQKLSQKFHNQPQTEKDAELLSGKGLSHGTANLEEALLLSIRIALTQSRGKEQSPETARVLRRLRELAGNIRESRKLRSSETKVCSIDDGSIARAANLAEALRSDQSVGSEEVASLDEVYTWLSKPGRIAKGDGLASSLNATQALLAAYTQERKLDAPAYQQALITQAPTKPENCLARLETPPTAERNERGIAMGQIENAQAGQLAYGSISTSPGLRDELGTLRMVDTGGEFPEGRSNAGGAKERTR